MIRVLLVDDHPPVLEGTKLLLEQDKNIGVQLADTGEKALELVRMYDFDVMLFDMHMPEVTGIELTRRVLRIKPDATILIFTGFDFTNHFNLMVEAGVSGFLSKTASREQLLTGVHTALRGEVVLPLSLVKQLRKLPLLNNETEVSNGIVTEMETQVLDYISKGKSNKDIAEMVHMSQRSLEYYLTNLFHKLHVKSRFEAVMKARNIGILGSTE